MSIIEAYNEAWDTGNVEALASIIHDDCVFNPHVGGITMSKSDILGFAGGEGRPTIVLNTTAFYSRMMKLAWPTRLFTLRTIRIRKPSCRSCGSRTVKSF